MRAMNVLQSYTDFDYLLMNLEFEDYKSKYLDLYEKVKQDTQNKNYQMLLSLD
jgi:type I restriction enzyme R subunit